MIQEVAAMAGEEPDHCYIPLAMGQPDWKSTSLFEAQQREFAFQLQQLQKTDNVKGGGGASVVNGSEDRTDGQSRTGGSDWGKAANSGFANTNYRHPPLPQGHNYHSFPSTTAKVMTSAEARRESATMTGAAGTSPSDNSREAPGFSYDPNEARETELGTNTGGFCIVGAQQQGAGADLSFGYVAPTHEQYQQWLQAQGPTPLDPPPWTYPLHHHPPPPDTAPPPYFRNGASAMMHSQENLAVGNFGSFAPFFGPTLDQQQGQHFIPPQIAPGNYQHSSVGGRLIAPGIAPPPPLLPAGPHATRYGAPTNQQNEPDDQMDQLLEHQQSIWRKSMVDDAVARGLPACSVLALTRSKSLPVPIAIPLKKPTKPAAPAAAAPGTAAAKPKKTKKNKKKTNKKPRKKPKVSRSARKSKLKTSRLRPMSAYNFYFQEERARIVGKNAENGGYDSAPPAPHVGPTTQNDRRERRKHPHFKISFVNLARLVGRRWKELTPEQRAPYEQQAKEDMKRYRIEQENAAAARLDKSEDVANDNKKQNAEEIASDPTASTVSTEREEEEVKPCGSGGSDDE